ncbi:copper-binding protein [Halopseudomonas nanhaiensis]|uniref:copper-binding protein n=1 Tax=Halopseudomonas nanhaiensis TaxID=2830842 RepID=UPI001CBE9001|nr:copper-binding protein [Halopseudomonas nanhaiensis]
MKNTLSFCLTLTFSFALAASATAGKHAEMQHGSGHDAQQHGENHDEASAQPITTTGTVKKIHPDKGMLTIAHAPVPELEWPAMTMRFNATAEHIDQVQEGDEIRFEFTSKGMNNSVISITKQ